MKAIKFKNFTDEVFVWEWDKVPYTFLPGMETFMEDFKARHFANHLIDRELNRQGKLTSYNPARQELLALALPEEDDITMEEAIDLEAKKKIAPKKKVEEEEFPELKKKGKK